ncbi:MAG: long-chain fatty acid transport protein [Bradymonadia bacterium]|jgi:long-chain fatty acid transport protein
MVGASVIVGHLAYTRERLATYQEADSFDFALPVSPNAIDPSKTGVAATSSTTPFGAAPTLFYARPIGDDWALGFGFYAPYAAIVDFPEEGEQRWALRDATITVAQLSAAVAWQPHERFSIGLGGSLAIGFAELSKELDLAGLDNLGVALRHPNIDQENDFGADAPPGVRELAVTSRDFALREAIGISGTFHLGVTASPTDHLLVSAAYQHSLPLTMRGVFELDMNDEFYTQDLEAQGLVYPALVEGDASLTFTLPSQVRAGFSYEASSAWTVGANLAAVFWDSIDTFDARVESESLAQPTLGLPATESVQLPRNWHAAPEFEFFTTWNRSDKHELWAVLGYHGSAVPDETIDASSPDGHRIVVAVGNRLQLTRRLDLIVDAEIHTLIPRTVAASDYDLGNGEYRLALISLGLLADVRF